MADNIVQGGMYGGLNFQPLSDDMAPFGSQPATIGPNIMQDPGPAVSYQGSSAPSLNALPALPTGFAPSQTSSGNTVTSQGSGASAANIAPTSQATPAPSNAAAQPSEPVAGTTIASGSWGDYFLRAVIIILGFIFVAIGLNMFRPGIIPNPVNLVKKA